MSAAGRDAKNAPRVHDRVYTDVRAFIADHGLTPGDRLPTEHDLCRLTCASRPIVREALKRLQAEGLIESRKGSGSFIRRAPFGSKTEHLLPAAQGLWLATLEVRIAVEPVAARLAAQHGSELERSAILAASGADFHRAVAVASHNAMFDMVRQTLQAQVDEASAPDPAPRIPDEAPSAADEEHRAIACAIARREAEIAEDAMRLHLLQARSRTIARFCAP